LDEKTREKLVASFEEAIRAVGAPSYEEGFETLARLIRFAGEGIETIGTRDKLRETLDRLPPLSIRDRFICMFIAGHLPQLLRWGLRKMADDAARTLPAMPAGRPTSMTANQREEALDYICKLLRQGVALEIAKQRTADKYGCSLRTIERYWAAREESAEESPTMDEINTFLLDHS